MSGKEEHTPIRTCLSCRMKRSKKSMIRMALDQEGKLLLDRRGTVPGRGAYVCPERECIDGLLIGGRIYRAFKKKGIAQVRPQEMMHLREVMARWARTYGGDRGIQQVSRS